MKKIKLLVMALAALTIASCSKENDTVDTLMPESAATVTIKITGEGNQVGSRATGGSGTEDVKVNNCTIFLFNKGGGIVGVPKFVSDVTEAVTVEGTTAAKNIYIVANTGPIADGPFKNVTSEAALKLATGELIANNVSTQTKANLWMAGNEVIGSFTAASEATQPSTAEVTVVLKFIAAKIDVVIKDERDNNVAGAGKISIKDDQVALLFAGAEGKFFETEANQALQSSFFSGIDYTSRTHKDVTTIAPALTDIVTNKFTKNTDETVEYHFYTFGNDATVMPTILTIQSTKRNTDGSDTPIYYPIHFSTTDAGRTIEPGQQYTVILTLKGDVNGGGGDGTTDPEEEVKSADIIVTVTSASWKTNIDVKKKFN